MIGFDDVAASALYTPPLTTVRQPMEAMGAGAVGIVLDGINGVLEKREVARSPPQSCSRIGRPGVDPQPAVMCCADICVRRSTPRASLFFLTEDAA